MDDFKQRFNAAKAQRQQLIDGAGREIYKFLFNGRESEWDRVTPADYQPEEIFTDFPATMAEDFGGELFSTMMPENAAWVEYETGSAVPEDKAKAVEEQIAQFENAVDSEITRSNFYTEGPTSFMEANIGNVAMWIEKPTMHGPTVCEAVPLPQLFLRLGPGGIADRFRRRMYYTRDLPALFPTANWPKKLKEKIEKAKSGRSEVIWGFWPTYKDPANPIWRQEIRVDGEAIGLDEDLEEFGAVKLIVGRFNPTGDSPWGRGPGLRMLPTIRVLNAVCEMTLEGMDRNLDPAYTYPHDGVLDLSEGIEQGLGYPSMPGSGDSVKPIGIVENLDYGFYSQDQLEMVLREGFYREIEQRGKTPPSASQYIGQEQKQLRRMARPAAKTWDEFGVGILRRFEFIARQPGGALEGLNLSYIDEGVVTVRPISPLERAQAREDVIVAQSILEMTMATVGQDHSMLLVDMPGTMKNVQDRYKDKLVKFRTEDQIVKLAKQMPQGGANGQE